jgi:hypothetical protein
MFRFNEYVKNNGDDLKVISVSSLNIDSINEQLSVVLSESSVNPYREWDNSKRVFQNFGIELPKVIFEDMDEGESVIILECEGTDYYFYYSFWLNEDGSYESFATVTDESGLEELLKEE